KRGSHLRLTQEALAKPLVTRQLGPQHLQSNATLQRNLGRRVNRAHRAVTEHCLDPIPGNRGTLRKSGHDQSFPLPIHTFKDGAAPFTLPFPESTASPSAAEQIVKDVQKNNR